MSRIGRMPIAIPAGVTVEVAENNKVTVKGPKGTLVRVLPSEMDIKVEGAEVLVSRPNDLKKMKSLHGLTRTLIHNMVVGVTEGFEKKLEVNGVGYRAAKSGKKLTLNLGYSHPVEMIDPEGIEAVHDGGKRQSDGDDIASGGSLRLRRGASAEETVRCSVRYWYPGFHRDNDARGRAVLRRERRKRGVNSQLIFSVFSQRCHIFCV